MNDGRDASLQRFMNYLDSIVDVPDVSQSSDDGSMMTVDEYPRVNGVEYSPESCTLDQSSGVLGGEGSLPVPLLETLGQRTANLFSGGDVG